MNKSEFGCRTLQDAVIVAGVFFVGSLLLFATARYLPFDLPFAQALLHFFAYLLLAFLPVILGTNVWRHWGHLWGQHPTDLRQTPKRS